MVARVIYFGSMLVAGGLIAGFILLIQSPSEKAPKCTSAISSISISGNHTVRGPVVWFPKGCSHG